MGASTDRARWFRGDSASCTPNPRSESSVFRMVLLGPPGVGKGTQAELLADCLNACHLSTGDLFRSALQTERPSPAMAAAASAMREGRLVSDELVMEMIRERQGCLTCKRGFLLDGVPRTVCQAKALEAMLDDLGVSLNGVISYHMPLESIVSRLGGRRSCPKCKHVYHVTANPPAKAGVCDHCGDQLVQREDDRPEAIRVRMKTYLELTQPLESFYEKRDLLISLDAEGSPQEVLSATLAKLPSVAAAATPEG